MAQGVKLGQIGLIVIVMKKGLLATVAALSYVVRKSRCYYSCYACHGKRIAEVKLLSIKYTVPGIPGIAAGIAAISVQLIATISYLQHFCFIIYHTVSI